MKVTLYNQDGGQAGTMDVPSGVFDAKWKPDLVHQAFVAEVGSRRHPLAHTKDRSEVAGGGKKPWRQKHTGRARHGSSRSPLWAGGGITFGPRSERVSAKKINKKARRAALFSILSRKFTDGEVKIVDRVTLPDHKTKVVAGIVKRLFPERGGLLCIPTRGNTNLFRAARNLSKTTVVGGSAFGVSALLSVRWVLLESGAIGELMRRGEEAVPVPARAPQAAKTTKTAKPRS
ncbi:MAG: 50S ribosomal protein L4 [Patescibacteria group bacterium]